VAVKFDRPVIIWSAGVCAGAAGLAAVLAQFTGSGWHKAVLVLLVVAAFALLCLIFAGLVPLGKIADWAGRAQPATPEEIDRARINLHATLSGAWSQEGSEVYQDLPMRVRFARVDGAAPKRLQIGDFDSVAKAFSQVPRYRRVVLGEAGAGKTVLVTELQRRLVEAPRPGDPLPVIVPAAAWRPDTHSLLDWLADQLATDYGWLPVAHARALVARGIVLPILDGLDEMPSSLRPVAIARINKYHVYRPLIVTSRAREYIDAVGETAAGVKGSVVVAVQPLRLKDTKAYLDAAGGDRWAKVLGKMHTDDDRPLAQVLKNPLMLWLARVEYEGYSPDELSLFGRRESLEDYLLAQFVPSVYPDDSGEAATGWFRCTAQQAQRWLGHLAWDIYQQYRSNQQTQEGEQEDEQEAKEDGHRTDTGGAPVLAWWEINRLADQWRRLRIALRTAVLSSVALVLGIWVLEQHGNWRHGAYSGPVNFGDLFLGGPVGRLIQPTMQVLVRTAQGIGKGGFVRGVHVFGGVFSVILSHTFVIVLATALFVIVIANTRSPDITDPHSKASWPPARLRIRAKGVLRGLARCCFLFGMAALAAFLLLHFAHGPVSLSVFFGSRSTWITLLAVSLIPLIWLPGSFLSLSDAYGNLGPDESLRLDREADVVVTVSKRSASSVAVWLFCGPPIAVAYAGYAIIATVVALALGGERSFASRGYVDARNWLAVQGRVPWRTMAFLADASRRGVLRQVGAAYQFRHLRLLEQVRHWRSAGDWGWLDRGKAHLGELTDMAHELVGRRREETLDGIREYAKRYRQEAEAGVEALPFGFAQTLEDLADRLRRWPDEQAQAALRDVLDTYRTLAASDLVAFGPGLARVLRKSASAFRGDEALGVSTEAVDYCRELAQTDPAFLPALAEAIADLASWLRSSDEGVNAAFMDGLNTYWTLAEADPVALRSGGIRLLRELASVTRWDKALGWSKVVVDCYRELAETDPVFLPALAEAASDRARRLSRLGRTEEALALTREIVDRARKMSYDEYTEHVWDWESPNPYDERSESNPPRFLSVLADSLRDLGDWLWESKSRREESVSAWREAAEIYRGLAEADPARFGSSLTSSLYILASAGRALRRQDEELRDIFRALDAYRERAKLMADIRHKIAEPEQAILLKSRREAATGKQALGHARSQEHKETLVAARNAAAAWDRRADCEPTEFLPDLADAADRLAIKLKSAGKRRAARILADEADRIRCQYRRSVDVTRRQGRETRPVAHVNNLALRLWKLGERQEAVQASQISRALAPANQAVAATEARGRTSPTRLIILFRETRQLQSWQNRVNYYRKHIVQVRQWTEKAPESSDLLVQARKDLATALGDQSDDLDTLHFRRIVSGRSKDGEAAARRAVEAQRESVSIYHKMYSTLPPSNRSGLANVLASSLETLALRLKAADRLEEAVRAEEEANEIRQWLQAPWDRLAPLAGSVPSREASDTPRTG
jgi:hypothetical protein